MAVAAGLSTPLFAASHQADEVVVVSGSRMEQKLEDVSGPISVITEMGPETSSSFCSIREPLTTTTSSAWWLAAKSGVESPAATAMATRESEL